MTLSLIIPVHNEIDQLDYTLKKLIKLKTKINQLEFVFIDDFSTDGTFKFLKKYSRNKKFIKLIKNKKKGLGSAIQEGIKKSKFDYVCIFMCDMSDDIKDVIKYYKLIHELEAINFFVYSFEGCNSICSTDPDSTIFPLYSTVIRSAIFAMTSRSCDIKT